MILEKAAELRDGKETNFRSFKEEIERKKQLTYEWKQRTKEKIEQSTSIKQQIAQMKERKRLDKMTV